MPVDVGKYIWVLIILLGPILLPQDNMNITLFLQEDTLNSQDHLEVLHKSEV